MMGVPWEGALAGLCLLRFAAAFITQPDFAPERFYGTWYTVGTALDSGYVTNEHLYRVTVEAGEKGSLIFRSPVAEQNCKMADVKLTLTEKVGKYQRIVSGKPTTFTVVETDYISFAIMGTESKDLRVLHLYTRAPEIPKDIREKFKELVRCAQFPTDSVMFHNTEGECPLN
nr:prostaglandin-H2 D-isomerase-like [Pogona vitticeps]